MAIRNVLSFILLIGSFAAAFPYKHDYEWVTHYIGDYSPYPGAAGPVRTTDPIATQYNIEQLHAFLRHDIRYPEEPNTKGIASVVQKLHSARNKTSVPWIDGYVNEFKTENIFQLHATGVVELYERGERMGASYSDLINAAISFDSSTDQLQLNEIFQSFVSPTSRTRYSAIAFHRGLFKGTLKEKANQALLGQYVKRFTPNQGHVDEEYDAMNGEQCDMAIHDPASWRMNKVHQCFDRFGMDAAKRITQELGERWVPEDVKFVYYGCAFDTSLHQRTDTFCSLLTPQEIENFYYCFDLKYYYTLGYGNRLKESLVCDLMRDTMDNIVQKKKKVITRVSHDTMIEGLAMLFELFKDSSPLEPDWSMERIKNRKFQGAKLMPFGANMVLQVLTEKNITEKDGNSNSNTTARRWIRFLLQEHPTVLPGCQKELCPLEDFIAWMHKRLAMCPSYHDACASVRQTNETPKDRNSLD
ncbi:phosphoglycerate mutase-like protein [Lichtheimia hyalospora FSU 10163]|nr:phosphoglycerate mutase-like protein [Lichtheimia hyalospora FSU 10163]